AVKWSADSARNRHLAEVFSDVVGNLWARRRSLPEAGRESFLPEKMSVVWQVAEGTVRALIASPDFVQSQWLTAAAAVARDQGVAFYIEGNENLKPAVTSTTRNRRDTTLPWNVVVTEQAPAVSPGAFAARRELLIGGFAVLVLLAGAANYFIIRAVNRELAVARLQSDFVAAVSHEFRTPLT